MSINSEVVWPTLGLEYFYRNQLNTVIVKEAQFETTWSMNQTKHLRTLIFFMGILVLVFAFDNNLLEAFWVVETSL